jgi:type IV secretory pathway VirB2 component (pilin)
LAQSGHFCAGLPSGAVVVLKDGQAVTDGAERGAVLFRQEEGLQQIIAALRGPRAQGLAVRDRAVAHVIYDGSADAGS